MSQSSELVFPMFRNNFGRYSRSAPACDMCRATLCARRSVKSVYVLKVLQLVERSTLSANIENSGTKGLRFLFSFFVVKKGDATSPTSRTKERYRTASICKWPLTGTRIISESRAVSVLGSQASHKRISHACDNAPSLLPRTTPRRLALSTSSFGLICSGFSCG